jgi:hypothetical protein
MTTKKIAVESKTFGAHMWRITQAQTKNACPPDVPPEVIPTAPAVSKAR